MPRGVKEEHPYLEKGQIAGATRLILGSFPVYDCTDPDNALKRSNRAGRGTFRFFYGSAYSAFWSLYGKFIDENIRPPYNSEILCTSMVNRQIAISDLIRTCERVGFSSADSKLRSKCWNEEGIRQLINLGITRILCTSKGVLAGLETGILCKGRQAYAALDQKASLALQAELLKKINGKPKAITKPIAAVFQTQGSDRQVKAIAIPSPGSPQRQLRRFGFVGGDWQVFADNYFRSAFGWLQEAD